MKPLPPLRKVSSLGPSTSSSNSGISSSSAAEFIPLSEIEEAEFIAISLDEPSEQPTAANQPGDSISSLSSVPAHVAKAKWKEFLDLLKLGYEKLIVDPDKERQAKALFQEICSGNPSFMPSEELQQAADDFATGFVEAVDIIRTHIHQLPFLVLSEQPTIATRDAILAKRRDAASFFKHYKAMDPEIRKIGAEVKELEDKLKAARDKFNARLAEQQAFGTTARRKLRDSRELEKELEVRESKEKALEKKRREATEQTFSLAFKLRSFVKKAEKALARAKW